MTPRDPRADVCAASPWMTDSQAIDYISNGDRTEDGRRHYSPRFLRNEVKAHRLRAARIGARQQLLFRREWLDTWLEAQATPIGVRPWLRA
jgi:hypothetical protein